MAQPTLSGLPLNAGSGGSDLLHDVVSSKIAQVELIAYSTGDGTLDVVMADTGLPVVSETGATWAVTQSGTWNITNISGTISLPTGAATAANQTTANSSLGSIDTSTSSIDAATNSIAGAISAQKMNINISQDSVGHALESGGNLATIAGAISGSEMQVDIVAALPAGTNAIGKLAANDGVDIGDVDVTSLPSDTFVAEDGALGKGVLFQGDDGTDRTNVLVDTDGHLQIDVLSCASHAVTNAGAFAVQVDGDALTALQLIDDTVAVLGTATYTEATTKGNVVGAVRNDDLATLANTDNEIAPLQVDAEGALYVNPAAAEPKRNSGVAAGGAPGADTLIAAPGASIKIRVLALGLFATSATVNNVYIDNEDNDLLFNSGNPLPLSLDADGDTVAGFVLPYNPGGWFETDAANEAVTLNTSAAQDIAWSITWIEVPG